VASNGISFTVVAPAPTVTSLNPPSGAVGTSVTISGTNFGATKGTSTATFNGTISTPTTWSATSIVVPVPAGATTGNVVVTVGTVASNGVLFTVTPMPSLTSLAPMSGPSTTSVTITGANFGATKGTSTATFNGMNTTPTMWSASSIIVPVPMNATTGNVVVTVGGGASNGISFTVVPTPSVTSLAPTSGPVATSVTITGTNFGATKGTSTATFNGTTAAPTTWAAASIVVSVPAGASTGPVVVTVGGVASNAVGFTVTQPGLPAPWTAQDVGSPAVAGSATSTSGTFSVTGAGADIYDTSDQFQFVYQTLAGDGEIVARVTGLQNTHGWAKAGVMIREDLTGGARHAFALMSAGAGMNFQQRMTRNGPGSTSQSFAGVAPNWVRLVRSGNTFSGYYSATGSAWILMGSVVVAMPSLTYVGLAVTSHNTAVATTGTFTNVTVTTTAPLSMTSQAPASGAVGTSGVLTGTNLGAIIGSSTASQPLVAPRTDDYDGDGKADVALLTPSTATWSILESSTGSALTATLGAPGDRPVSGDYEGDGKTDMAVYRPATGEWSVLLSSTGALTAVTWGSATDLPVPADYDRDGKTDMAVYRPTTGEWIILESSTQTARTVAWGSSADVPVPGDYDGDMKADLAVYRDTTGLWQILQSGTNAPTTVTWGSTGSLAMPGDYDGDGRIDVAVYDTSTGLWSIAESSTATTRTVTWGSSSDVPMPGDYDGDGTTDLAVFRPSTGLWQILQSSTNATKAVTWGTSNNIPVR
jgi:hypothetical protein